MSAIRLSVAARQDGATNGQVPIWSASASKWTYGSPVPAAHTHVEGDVTSLATDLASKIPKSQVTAKGDLLVATASGVVTNLPVGADTFILTADSTQASGVKWTAASGGFADPTTTKGDLIARSASATTRLPVGTDGQVLTADSTQTLGLKWAAAVGGAGGGGGGLLGVAQYQPGSDTTYTTSATAMTWQALDSTNLSVTFTAPASGQVVVVLSALADYPNTIGDRYFWGVGSGTVLATGSVAMVVAQNNTSVVARRRITLEVLVTGLTPGASYTWKWMHTAAGASVTAANTFAGPSFGPALMAVLDGTAAGSSASNGFLYAGSLGGPSAWVTTTSTTLVAIDTTNAIFTFTAPASGKVVVTLEQATYVTLNVGNNSMAWGLINASGGAVLAVSYFNAVTGSSANWQRLSIRLVLTGLTAGTSYTLQWGHLSSSSSNTTGTFNGGGLVLVQAA